jgi:hypothetical protein
MSRDINSGQEFTAFLFAYIYYKHTICSDISYVIRDTFLGCFTIFFHASHDVQ